MSMAKGNGIKDCDQGIRNHFCPNNFAVQKYVSTFAQKTRRRRKMTRQAGKLSGLGTYQGVWYRHASAVAASGPLFWSNTIVVAYEKMIRSARACSLCHAKNRPHDQFGK